MQTGIPAPVTVHAALSAPMNVVLWGALMLAAVAGAAVLAVRNRDTLPLAACAGAVICALNEPIYDVLGHLVYTSTPSHYVAYTALGRRIPWFVVMLYVPWVGLMPYVIAQRIAAGISRARLHLIAGGLTLSVVVAEAANAAWLHDWKYYGGPTVRVMLSGGVVQMAAMPLLCALLYCQFAHRLTGWKRASAGLILPAMALPMAFAATTWPLYVSSYSSASAAIKWAGAVITIGLCAAEVLGISYLAETWQRTQASAVDSRDAPGASQPPRSNGPAQSRTRRWRMINV